MDLLVSFNIVFRWYLIDSPDGQLNTQNIYQRSEASLSGQLATAVLHYVQTRSMNCKPSTDVRRATSLIRSVSLLTCEIRC